MFACPYSTHNFSEPIVKRAQHVLSGHRSIVNQVRYNAAYNIIASSGVEKIIKVSFLIINVMAAIIHFHTCSYGVPRDFLVTVMTLFS